MSKKILFSNFGALLAERKNKITFSYDLEKTFLTIPFRIYDDQNTNKSIVFNYSSLQWQYHRKKLRWISLVAKLGEAKKAIVTIIVFWDISLERPSLAFGLFLPQFVRSTNIAEHKGVRWGYYGSNLTYVNPKIEILPPTFKNVATLRLRSSKSSVRSTAAGHVGQNSSANVASSFAAIWTLILFK